MSAPGAGGHALHVVVDMQRLFAEATDWHVPSFAEILPRVHTLTRAFAGRTLFTRFMTPASARAVSGTWRAFYERWPNVTLERMDSAMLDIVQPLAGMATADRVFDKTTFSAFAGAAFRDAVARSGADTLIVSGVETDVCVLATLLPAVDAGLRVLIPVDAVTSGSLAAHAAVLEAIVPRHPDQIALTTTAELLAGRRAA